MNRLIHIEFEEDGGHMPMQAWDTDVPGLVITHWATDEAIDRDGFAITQEHSGLRISSHRFYSQEIAGLFANEIASHADWTAKPDKLRKHLEKTRPIEEWRELWGKMADELEAKIEANPFEHLPSLAENDDDDITGV